MSNSEGVAVEPGKESMERAVVVISSRTEEVVKVRKTIGALSRRSGFSDDAACGIEVAVGEALANAVCHGSPEGEQDTVEISYRQVPNRYLEVVVQDHGTGFNLQDRVERARPLDLTEGDRGVFLICALMDEVSYSYTGAGGRLCMKKYMSGARKPNRGQRRSREPQKQTQERLQNAGVQSQIRAAPPVQRFRPAA